jgi:ABC-type amino acid transport substrate-binding protein
MIRQFIAVASAALLACAAQPPASAGVPERIGWTIAPAGEAVDQVQLSLRYRTATSNSTWSSSIGVAELEGIAPAQLAAASATDVRFQIVREAGRFLCEGSVRRGNGAGDCSFEADAGFAATLAERGVGRPDRDDSFHLALARVGIALLDELARQDYRTPDVSDLVAAGIHRVDIDYIRAMAGAGYRVGTVEGLVQMRIHRVTPDYVRALEAAGYRPDADMAVQMRIHGISPDYVRELAAAGGGRFSTEDLVAMRIHGVTPAFVTELGELGYRDLSADNLTAMRIHGVTGDFVRRQIGAGGARPSPDELVSRRLHGGR